LQGPIVMQAVYRLITVLWVPERNTSGRQRCSRLSSITITNISATSTQTGQVGGSGFRGWGHKLEVGGSPVIGIGTGTWGIDAGRSEGVSWGRVNAVPVVVLNVDVVGKALNLGKIGLVLSLSSKGVRYRNWE